MPDLDIEPAPSPDATAAAVIEAFPPAGEGTWKVNKFVVLLTHPNLLLPLTTYCYIVSPSDKKQNMRPSTGQPLCHAASVDRSVCFEISAWEVNMWMQVKLTT